MSFEPAPPPDQDRLLAQARDKLRAPRTAERHWAALAAAAFFAVCAIGFAVASILAPALSESPAAKSSAP